jgi:predicted DNA-binding ribbon-helix-helix protein
MPTNSDKLSTKNVQVGSSRTTIAVEPECWQMLIEISRQQKITLPALIQEIESGRDKASRASAIRLYIMNHYRSAAIANGFMSSTLNRRILGETGAPSLGQGRTMKLAIDIS